MVTELRCSSLLERFAERGDEQRIAKVRQLLASEGNGGGRVHVALCGHFSAGKSSLINKLAGHKLLPSSPIPTSANIVSIQDGPERVEVEFHDGRPPQIIAIDGLTEVCKDGENIGAVRIFYPLAWLGGNVVLLDTPGIDSTDGAHALATHSALHMADLVFYVTDYNHVQSEVNFEFAKMLADWGKPLYFVINQMDKHKQSEISFSEYERRIRESFALWGIEPAGFLFMSAKYDDHPLNQFPLMQNLLRDFAGNTNAVHQLSVAASIKQLIDEHVQFIREQQADERRMLHAQLDGIDVAQIRGRYEQLTKQMTQLAGKRSERTFTFQNDMDRLLQNAPLTPAPLRELAKAYLESQKPSFRSGFLWFGKSTEEVRAERTAQFTESFATQVETQIIFHAIALLNQLLGELNWSLETWHERIASTLVHGIDGEFLRSRMKVGALDSGEALLNYCADLAEETKRRIRQSVVTVLGSIEQQWLALDEQQVELVRTEMEACERTLSLERQLASLEEKLAQVAHDLQQHVTVGGATEQLLPQIPTPDESLLLEEWQGSPRATVVEIPKSTLDDDTESIADDHIVDTMLSRLDRAIECVRQMPLLAQSLTALEGKRTQLQNRAFTAALFGAFSAGKSSFANALMGTSLLPVSPNPTTAAINQIVPGNVEYPHGTVQVRMKTEQRLADDVLHSLKLLGVPCHTFAEGLKAIPTITAADVSVKGRPHLSFLQAVHEGWAQSQSLLGSSIRCAVDDFAPYVADERRSCFVEDIQVHHDNELTRNRISLVDTPGADSVNARHTHVSFEYIKNADVILFVTYYNHAFSQADRDFLVQLGRVKDRFQLDKMLFVINAADLAESTEELQHVCEHVRAQLAQFGIQNPKLFPLSSQNGLLAKTSASTQSLSETGLLAFEQAFYRFIREQLAALLCYGAEQELAATEQSLQRLLTFAHNDEQQKQRELESMRLHLAKWRETFASRDGSHLFAALRRENEELIYYVKQRQRFAFGERFARSFNPAALREDLRDSSQAMRAAWFDLLAQMQTEATRELQATALRMEQHMRTELEQTGERMQADIREQWSTYTAPFSVSPFASALFADTFQCDIDLAWLAKQYRSSKAFFAENGSVRLRAQLEQLVLPALDRFVDKNSEQMFNHYREAFEGQLRKLVQHIIDSLSLYVEQVEQSAEQVADTGALQQLAAAFREI